MPKAKAKSLPQGNDIPAGFNQIGGGYAKTWDPAQGDTLQGPTTSAVKVVSMKQGRNTVDRRCVEITDTDSGERHTLWESAILRDFFDALEESGEGTEVYVRFDGLGTAKKGQNAPKLFTVAIAA